MASSFSYFFIGKLPFWLALGAAGLGYGLLHGRMRAAWELSAGLRIVVSIWLLLIFTTGILDLFGYMPRDVAIGPALSFATLIAFLGIFTLATFADNMRVLSAIILITVFQSILAIAQYFGSETAWRFPELLTDLLPFARIEYSDTFDVSLMTFEQVGRVRGSVPHVHIFSQIQEILVSFCIAAMFSKSRFRFRSRLLNMLGWAAVALGSVSLFLSLSRSGIITLLGVTLFALIFNPKPIRIVMALFSASFILAILVYIGLSESAQFYRISQDLGEGTTNIQRLEQYDLAWQNFLNNPMIGASGPNGYSDLLLPIHSVPLRYLNDYGLVGFVLYMLIFGGLVFLFSKRLKSPSPIVSSWAACGFVQLLVVVIDNWTHSSGFLRRDLLHAVILGFVAGAMLSSEWRAGLGRTKSGRKERPQPAGVYNA